MPKLSPPVLGAADIGARIAESFFGVNHLTESTVRRQPAGAQLVGDAADDQLDPSRCTGSASTKRPCPCGARRPATREQHCVLPQRVPSSRATEARSARPPHLGISTAVSLHLPAPNLGLDTAIRPTIFVHGPQNACAVQRQRPGRPRRMNRALGNVPGPASTGSAHSARVDAVRPEIAQTARPCGGSPDRTAAEATEAVVRWNRPTTGNRNPETCGMRERPARARPSGRGVRITSASCSTCDCTRRETSNSTRSCRSRIELFPHLDLSCARRKFEIKSASHWGCSMCQSRDGRQCCEAVGQRLCDNGGITTLVQSSAEI